MVEIPQAVKQVIRNRKALLWVCQQYDLAEGEEPHDYGLSETEARLRYRTETTEIDQKLAAQFWEAVWLEGAASPLLSAFHEFAKKTPSTICRPIVELVTKGDCDAEVPTAQFLPISILPGHLLKSKPIETQYGQSKSKRSRERIAERLSERLNGFPGRVLVVLGAECEPDLERVIETIEEMDVFDFKVLFILPETVSSPTIENPAVQSFTLPTPPMEFITKMDDMGAPSADDVSAWTLRIGAHSLNFDARKFQNIDQQMAVIRESQLSGTDQFTMDDLRDFFDASLDNMTAYRFGLPIRRNYLSGDGKSFTEEVLESLNFIRNTKSDIFTRIIKLPVGGGAGSTTLLRHAAFVAAENGFPTFIVRPDQIDLNTEQLIAFLTHLNEKMIQNFKNDLGPILLILDEEHQRISVNSQLSGRLAAAGRKAVIVQAVPISAESQDSISEERNDRFIRLLPLSAKVYGDEEIKLCHEVFSRLSETHNLPIEVPELSDWVKFEENAWISPDGITDQSRSNFWVALQFFLTSGMDYTLEDEFKDVLGTWIDKRFDEIEDEEAKQIVTLVAALSSFYITAPFWSTMRAVVGNSFSTTMLDTIRQASDLLEWGESSSFMDQTLRFKHPSLASEILRRRGVRTKEQRLGVLQPLLNRLTAKYGDLWLAESLVYGVISPSFEEKQNRHDIDWEWRLGAFDFFPPVVTDSSRTVLLHWARCLYLSAENENGPLTSSQRQERLKESIYKLERGLKIPKREGVRDESKSNLFNTLGAAWDRYRRFLENSEGDGLEEAEVAWNQSCEAFEKAITYSGGTNVEALLAFSNRLIKNITGKVQSPPQMSNVESLDLIRALGLLDEADETLETSTNPDPNQEEYSRTLGAEAQNWLNMFVASNGGEAFKEIEPDLGYYCEARLCCTDRNDDSQVQRALKVFEQADEEGVTLSSRPTLFRISLMRWSNKAEDYEKQLQLYRQLEKSEGFSLRMIDKFRKAVLEYQTERFPEGAESFRRLREEGRRSEQATPRVRDFLRAPSEPTKPRKMSLMPTRIMSEFRGYGLIQEMEQEIPFRPRHWSEMPEKNRIIECGIQFEFAGPRAVPLSFIEKI